MARLAASVRLIVASAAIKYAVSDPNLNPE
jgi:hypothetical protein